MSKNNDQLVLVNVKTPMMARGTSAFLKGSLSAAQALAELQRLPPKSDSHTMHVLQQLARETAVHHDLLTVGRSGEVTRIDPSKTLNELAVPRVVRTSQGNKLLKAVALEAQMYAAVGS